MEQFVDLFLSPNAATLVIKDILTEIKLLSLHPHWFVEDTVQKENGLFVKLRDYATEKEFSLGLHLDTIPAQDDPAGAVLIFRLTLFDSEVQDLLFFTEQEQTRVRIRYKKEQPTPEQEEDTLLWIRGIQEYLRLYTRTTVRTRFFRLLMNKMVLQMNPSQRKICLMIAKITVVEIVVILLIVIGYVSFGQ